MTSAQKQLEKSISHSEIEADFSRLLWSAKLKDVTRFFKQRYWENETQAELRRKEFSDFRLENVAEHSWHLADAVVVLGPRFERVNVDRAIAIASLHDLLEIETGDFDPIGTGEGADTHAFSKKKSEVKNHAETLALKRLKRKFHDCTTYQFDLIEEYLSLRTREALFVKALDKIQVLILVWQYKCEVGIEASHVDFANNYCRQQVSNHFPELSGHLEYMLELVGKIPQINSLRKSA